tara:strand:- start:147 stop:326 length:180 start_codon:yes stop_codon:yes gene_type:complete
MRITKVTTRNGDSGKTSLAKGESVLKSDNIIHCLGEVDELSSIIGVSYVIVKILIYQNF